LEAAGEHERVQEFAGFAGDGPGIVALSHPGRDALQLGPGRRCDGLLEHAAPPGESRGVSEAAVLLRISAQKKGWKV
jgi:hypothetical protein